MKIVVCVKQVPGASNVKIDPETKRLGRDGVVAILNPFDLHALEAAIELRGLLGAEVVALSMGPPKAEEALREALAFGADRAALLCDRRFAGSDTWATSHALALAVRKLGDVGLVLCGKQAIDGDTAQVGPEMAAHLGWAQAANVAEITPDGATHLVVRRLLDGGQDRCRLRLPAVLAVAKEIAQPRVPSLKGYLRALSAPLEVWDAAAIGADESRLGLKGSPTRVVRTATPPPRGRCVRTLTADMLDELLEELCHADAI